MALVKREIGELLVDNGQISPEELKRAQDEKAKSGEPMSVVLSKLGLADESQVKNALELEYGVSYVSLKKTALNPELLATAGESLCREFEAAPISKDSARLTLAMVTPSNQAALDAFKKKFSTLQIKPVVCIEADLASFLDKAFGPASSKKNDEKSLEITQPPASAVVAKPKTVTTLKLEPIPAAEQAPKVEPASKVEPMPPRAEPAPKVEPAPQVEPVTSQAEQAGRAEAGLPPGPEDMAIVLLGNHILSNALSRGCTNIHIEPTDKEVLVHYRKDGVLFAARKLPKAILPFLVNRFKTMAQISTSERNLPQDGRLNVQVSGKQLSFRLSIVPAGLGEHLVIWLD
jgi:type II secretory ATPase GspE/PulE/Tfp pilus assembly ATPase PilB-like protein